MSDINAGDYFVSASLSGEKVEVEYFAKDNVLIIGSEYAGHINRGSRFWQDGKELRCYLAPARGKYSGFKHVNHLILRLPKSKAKELLMAVDCGPDGGKNSTHSIMWNEKPGKPKWRPFE